MATTADNIQVLALGSQKPEPAANNNVIAGLAGVNPALDPALAAGSLTGVDLGCSVVRMPFPA
jgi:hypothetical protein